MEKIENLKSIITSNLIKYRKQAGLTQAQLASKLGYSDKTVSKWEREEGVPDIYILKQIADLYGITVNDLISQAPSLGEKIKEKTTKFLTWRNKLIITFVGTGFLRYMVRNMVGTLIEIGEGKRRSEEIIDILKSEALYYCS